MARDEDLATRGDRLKQEIEAARVRLNARRDFAGEGMGEVIEVLSDEVDEITHLYDEDPEEAHQRLNGVEERLGAARSRLDQADDGRAG